MVVVCCCVLLCVVVCCCVLLCVVVCCCGCCGCCGCCVGVCGGVCGGVVVDGEVDEMCLSISHHRCNSLWGPCPCGHGPRSCTWVQGPKKSIPQLIKPWRQDLVDELQLQMNHRFPDTSTGNGHATTCPDHQELQLWEWTKAKTASKTKATTRNAAIAP